MILLLGRRRVLRQHWLRVQEYILHRIDPRRDRSRVATHALAGGLIYGFSFLHPFHVEAKKLSKLLLQASVVGLGLAWICSRYASRTLRFIYTAAASASRCSGLGARETLARKAKNLLSHLCRHGHLRRQRYCRDCPNHQCEPGRDCRLARTVFALNSIALLTFPAIGIALHMTQSQFGLWSALAIHDISSVVGATAKYGAVALTVGTTVKLARALWIVPLSVGTAMAHKSKARIHGPGSFSSSVSRLFQIHTSTSSSPSIPYSSTLGASASPFTL